MRRRWISMGAVVAAAALVSCGGDPVRDGSAAPEGVDAAAPDVSLPEGSAPDACAPAACQGLVFAGSDGVIAALLEAQDQAEVSLAQTVRDGLADPNVVAFAEKMITDHTLLDLQVGGSVRTDAIGLLPDGASAAIAAQENETAQVLGALSGAPLDRAYMAHEVLVHMQELSWLDHLAIPDVKDVRLAADVAATEALAATHAELALQVLNGLPAP
jgi:putative membrane protein